MYRATPLSYYISAIISTGLFGTGIVCSAKDIARLDTPSGQTCGSYLDSYAKASGSVILNPDDATGCEVCPYSTADSLLAYFNIYFEDRWWQWGVTIGYNVANIALAVLLYWIARVPKGARKERNQQEKKTEVEDNQACHPERQSS